MCKKFRFEHNVPIDPATVFATFDMKQLGKIRRHHCKERLKRRKTAKFESDTS